MLKNTLAKLTQLLGQSRQNCLLCQQVSPHLICDICDRDLHCFEYLPQRQNLMLNPEVYKALSNCHFPELKVLTIYQWPVSQLITQLKFNHKVINARALAELFYRHVIQNSENLPQVLIPVPLHKKRYFERHYNQALLLSEHIAKLANISVDTNLCLRGKNTQPQTDSSAVQRRKNLNKAFQIDQIHHYQHLAIVDDVITTGATANSLFQCLEQVLPQAKIEIWAMAISLPHR